MPLQNVRSSRSSPKRGKASTRMRVRRTIQAPSPLEPGVDQIGVGDVLEPARHRVQAAATRRRRRRRSPGASRRSKTRPPRPVDELRQSRSHPLLELLERVAQPVHHRPEVRDLVAVGDDPEVHVAVVAHHRDVQAHAVGDHRDGIVGDQLARRRSRAGTAAPARWRRPGSRSACRGRWSRSRRWRGPRGRRPPAG